MQLSPRAVQYGLAMVRRSGGALKQGVRAANSYEKKLLAAVGVVVVGGRSAGSVRACAGRVYDLCALVGRMPSRVIYADGVCAYFSCISCCHVAVSAASGPICVQLPVASCPYGGRKRKNVHG